ncbi:MAG: 4Fe-4S binding protein [Clostridia bacterium]|nr:4Fe-4S binding protein [Clostridia bacterium]
MRTKMILKFPKAVTNEPITYELIKKYDLRINILKADINFKLEGHLIFDVDGNSKDIAGALEYLENLGVEADLITSTINIDSNKCVSCGLCTSACAVKALHLNREDWSLNYTELKCVGCNLCISTCPTRAITNTVW